MNLAINIHLISYIIICISVLLRMPSKLYNSGNGSALLVCLCVWMDGVWLCDCAWINGTHVRFQYIDKCVNCEYELSLWCHRVPCDFRLGFVRIDTIFECNGVSFITHRNCVYAAVSRFVCHESVSRSICHRWMHGHVRSFILLVSHTLWQHRNVHKLL